MLGAEAASVQIEAERKELQRLQSYQAAGGKICAERDCTVLQAGVQAGAVTSGSEVFVTGSGGFRLKGWAKPTDREKLRTISISGLHIRTEMQEIRHPNLRSIGPHRCRRM